MKWLTDVAADFAKRLDIRNPGFIRALMVDDCEDDYFFARKCVEDAFRNRLCQAKISIEWVRTSEQAQEKIQQACHDVYIIDWKIVVEGDGLELIRDCRKLGFHGPFIILTGSPEEAMRRDARTMLEYGVMGFVDKRLSVLPGLCLIIQLSVSNFRLISSLIEATL